jgi:hypothetical protein
MRKFQSVKGRQIENVLQSRHRVCDDPFKVSSRGALDGALGIATVIAHRFV